MPAPINYKELMCIFLGIGKNEKVYTRFGIVNSPKAFDKTLIKQAQADGVPVVDIRSKSGWTQDELDEFTASLAK